jgi:hypothetical protein
MDSLTVVRYTVWDELTNIPLGDYLRVGDHDLGQFRDIVGAEYARAKVEHPENPAFHMRPMFHTGSGFGAEILDLAKRVRNADVYL